VIVSNIVLLVYHHPLSNNAPTILEHVRSFERYSNFSVISLNTAYGFPRHLRRINFSAIVLHYSMFGGLPFALPDRFRAYISSSKAKKIAFFQDEMQYVQNRFALVNELGVDVIFTLLNPEYFQNIYLKNTTVKTVKQTLTGYVCDELVQKASKYFIPFDKRTIDVGYRARNLRYHYGRGAREKSEIAERFLAAIQQTNLKIYISTREEDRIYGDNWYQFIANCRFMLGVMAGTSIFDMTGEVKEKTDLYLSKHPEASFEQVEMDVLAPYEQNVNYRTISPRIFECVALRVCMILYRDDYQGVLEADQHYIPLEKDFSNINSVLLQMKDQSLIDQITENAFRDIIASGKWHYREFMGQFDQTLEELSCNPSVVQEERRIVESAINKDVLLRSFFAWLKSWRSRSFPGRQQIKWFVHRLGFMGVKR
jgi:hypothetical protein